MSEQTPRLNLPLILPAQAQKHVTHNEAIAALDAVVQLVVQGVNADTPPSAPNEGDVYALGASPTGDWTGEARTLAVRQNTGWAFSRPSVGWRAWDTETSALYAFGGTEWVPVAAASNNIDGLGIRTSWDTDNRLAVSSDAVLLSHAGAGHQVKVNKAAETDTASLLFQNDYTGHAEMGLAGDNAFSVKVSADGSNWDEAWRVDPDSQTITAGYTLVGDAIQQSADDTTTGRLMRADYGYGPGNVIGSVSQTSGVPSGALFEQGENDNGFYSRWADGTQICWVHAQLIYDTAFRLRFDWNFPQPFGGPSFPVISANLQNEFGATPNATALHGPYAAQGNTPNKTVASLRVYRSDGYPNFETDDSLVVQAMAVGRWY